MLSTEILECEVCQASFERRSKHGITPKYCSPKCVTESQRLRYLKKRNDPEFKAAMARNSRRRYERVCADDRLLAAQREMTRLWRANNPEHLSNYDRARRLARPDVTREKNQKRRARLLNAFVENVDLRLVWDRDEGMCKICELPVDPDLKWPHKMSKTLDHIVPLSKNGEHSYANVQLAHAVCNSRKNNFTREQLQV